jgi:predicted nicotinamide N-methyase
VVINLHRKTDYRGPVIVTTLRFAEQTVRLHRPADPDRMLDDPAVAERNRRDDYMPYWAYLWPGAYLLAQAVACEAPVHATDHFESAEVLEIGCGLGLPGLVALARRLRVQFTDYDPAPLKFVRRSIRENGLEPARAVVRRLDWRNLPEATFSKILGADVIYEEKLVPLVANLLARMLDPAGTAVIATPYRVAAERFPAAVERHGLLWKLEHAEARAEEGRLVTGMIYRVTRP